MDWTLLLAHLVFAYFLVMTRQACLVTHHKIQAGVVICTIWVTLSLDEQLLPELMWPYLNLGVVS